MVLARLKTLTANEDDPELSPITGGPQTFAELLDYTHRTWGEKIALQQKVRREWQRLSHDEVSTQAYELAAGFIALGLNPGDRVAMIAENSIEWVLSYYAIILAGGVAIPIYYDLQPPEVAEMLERGQPAFAVVSAKSHARFRDALASIEQVVVVGAVPQANGAGSPPPKAIAFAAVAGCATEESRRTVEAVHPHPDDLASIVFTSGTTGGMKGVMLTQRNFMANLQQVRRSIPFNDRDRLVMVLPMHHAFPFTVSMVVAPYVGGVLTFENDLRRIRDRMAEVKPTVFIGVPQLFEVMYRNVVHSIEAQGRLDAFERGRRIVETTKQRTGINIGRIVFRELHKRLGGSLRFMVSGGAALNPQIALNFSQLGVPILQGWGLTEAAPVLAVQRWNPRKFYMSNYYEDQVGTVGPALDGVEIALIDVPEKELYVHLHGEGELVAHGENISPGYWQAEEATDAMKVDGWLRTGDVGRIDEDGNIWITGRSKFVIVLESGEKIHPDEVEVRLERSSAIEDVAIIGRKVRGKTQPWAIVYPNRDEVTSHLGHAPATEGEVRDLIEREMDANEVDVALFKRPVDFMLTDLPLPRTAPLRKIARGQIGDGYTFELRRWEQSWQQHVADNATPSGQPDDAEELEPVTA